MIKYGRVTPEVLTKVVPNDAQGLWEVLYKQGYIDAQGIVQVNLKKLDPPNTLNLERFNSKRKEILALLERSQQNAVVREWTESIVVALVLALLIRTFVIQAFKIPSGSMRMTLLEGDRILVSKYIYGPRVPFTNYRISGLGSPKRGDIVVFEYPEDRSRDFIKRLIAVGGDTVEIKDGHIYIDGKIYEDPLIKNRYYYNQGAYGQPGRKIKVPENHYFVLGDNSASSKDSRYWGFVPKDLMIGRAELIYWPPNRIRFIK